MTPPLPYIIAGRKRLAAWFLAGLSLLFLLAFAFGKLEKQTTLICVLSVAMASLFIFINATLLKIGLLHDGFVYTPARGAAQKLRWADIAATAINVRPFAVTTSFGWEVKTHSGRRAYIQLGYFSRKDMQTFAQTLVQHASRAHISTRVQAIAEGRFPWWLF